MAKYRPIFITATNTNVGKTYATCKLLKELSKKGFLVGVFKPIETGVIDTPLDGKILLDIARECNPNLKTFTCRDIVPIQFKLPASPYVSKEDKHIDIKSLHVAFDKIASVSDIVLIEGAGGLMVPIEEHFYMYDFIKEFNAMTLLVTHANLGCINDTLLNINLLKSLHVEYEWCVNFRDNKKDFENTTLPFYKNIISLQDDMKLLSEKLVKSLK